MTVDSGLRLEQRRKLLADRSNLITGGHNSRGELKVGGVPFQIVHSISNSSSNSPESGLDPAVMSE